MNDENNTQRITTLDEENIKLLTSTIRRYSIELEKIRKHADLMWDQCNIFFDRTISDSIASVKDINRKKYFKVMENLDNYVDRMDSVANIWKETETEIVSSSKALENFFIDIGKTFSDIALKSNDKKDE